MKGDLFEIRQRDQLEFLLLINLPEEAGVVEAGAEDFLVTLANEAVGIAIGVSDGDEFGSESAIGSLRMEK